MTINTFFLIATVAVSFWAWQNQRIMELLILHPVTIFKQKAFYRLLSSGFIHQGFIHLLFNMIALFFFGRNVEHIFRIIFPDFGGAIYVIFYLSAIVVSDLPTLFKQKENPKYFSLGASGGVSAIVFCWILFYPLELIYIYFIPIPGFILGVLYIIYSYYQSRNAGSRINHDAHLYGAVYGLLFTAIVYPSVIPRFFSELSGFSLF